MNAILLCRTKEVPSPEQVAEMLRGRGYSSFVEVSNRYPTQPAAEIRYAPGRMPIVVKFDNDWHDNPDEKDYEYMEWIEELVPNETAREGVRRFAFVDTMENVEAKAFQAVVEYIREQTNAIVVLQEQTKVESD